MIVCYFFLMILGFYDIGTCNTNIIEIKQHVLLGVVVVDCTLKINNKNTVNLTCKTERSLPHKKHTYLIVSHIICCEKITLTIDEKLRGKIVDHNMLWVRVFFSSIYYFMYIYLYNSQKYKNKIEFNLDLQTELY